MKEQEQEDRAGYVLPFRTTKSQISESVVGILRAGSRQKEKKKVGTVGRSEKSLRQCSSPSSIAVWSIGRREDEKTSELSVAA